MAAPALPSEILGLIAQYSVISCFRSEYRLHLSSSRCSSCGTNRQVFPCPAILLVNSELHDLGIRALYRTAFIVIQIDHKCNNKDLVQELIGRTSILSSITNIELFFRRAAAFRTPLLGEHQPGILCRPITPPFCLFEQLRSALPNVKKVCWTIGIPNETLPNAAFDNYIRTIGGYSPLGFTSLVSVLNNERLWPARITRFRLWLSYSMTEELSSIVHRVTSRVDAQTQENLMCQIKTHAVIEPLVHTFNLEQLDIFFYTSRSAMSDPSRRSMHTFNRLSLTDINLPIRGRTPRDLCPDLHRLRTSFTERLTGSKEREQLVTLLPMLKSLFNNVQHVNFWRIRYGNVLNNAFEELDIC